MTGVAHNAEDLGEILASTSTWKPVDPSDKWTPLLLSPEALRIYSALLLNGAYTPLQTWGETTLGMVTALPA